MRSSEGVLSCKRSLASSCREANYRFLSCDSEGFVVCDYFFETVLQVVSAWHAPRTSLFLSKPCHPQVFACDGNLKRHSKCSLNIQLYSDSKGMQHFFKNFYKFFLERFCELRLIKPVAKIRASLIMRA